MSNIGKKHLTIAPSNSTSDNTYSSSNNQSVLRFDIGSSGMMIGQDVRLEFEMEFFHTNGATAVTMANDFNVDPYLMHNSVIKSISWQSRRFNEKVLEKPESLTDDPYQEGWLIEISVKNDFSHLMSSSQYENYLKNEA